MMKCTIATTGLAAALLTLGGFGASTAQADAFQGTNLSIGAGVGTTGAGIDAEWRFSEHFGLVAGYHGGLDYDGDHDTDEVTYTGDIGINAGALKLAYHPFGGSFYVTAGAMLPDMEADVQGRAKSGQSYEYNGNTYTAAQVGTLNGKLIIADGVQPYAGIGWRSSHESGLGFVSELGVMSTDVEVSLSSSENYEANNAQFREDLRQEEKRLEDEADELSVYPVAMLGVTYTF